MGRMLIHIIPAICISFIVQIVLHELGHMIGGLITGWRLLYIQVHKLVFNREDRRLKIIVAGDIGYRCIMYPVTLTTNALIYTMGGCIINLLSGACGLIIMITAPLSPVMWLYTWCFTVFGIGMYFMNGIASTKRVCNDKACYKLLKADKQTKKCHNGQLLIAKDLVKGLTYSQIRRDIIYICPDVIRDDIQAYQSLLEYYYYLDTKNILKVGQALNKIQSKDNISKDVFDIHEMELNYMILLSALIFHVSDNKNFSYNKDISSCIVNKNCIDDNLPGEITLNLKEIKKAIKTHEKDGDIHSLRVKAVYRVYECLVTKDKAHGMDIVNKAIEVMNKTNYVYKGEKRFNINQLLWIKELVESSKDVRETNIEKAV